MSRVAVIAEVKLTPSSIGPYVEAAKAALEPTRQEAGCERYGFGLDIADPHTLGIAEQWSSKEALYEHLKTAHIQAFLAAVGTLDIVDMDARVYEVDKIGPIELPK